MKGLIGTYDKSVALTYVGLLVTVIGMTAALGGRLRDAMTCLLISGLCDMYDGAVAALCTRDERGKLYGIQIDSLCDVVCFSVFPAIICYSIAGRTPLAAAAMCAIVLCGAVRLAYFNVQEALRQSETVEKRTHYQGLPVTASAIILPIGMMLFRMLRLDLTVAMPVLVLCNALLNVLDIKVIKPQETGKLVMLALGALTLLAIWTVGR